MLFPENNNGKEDLSDEELVLEAKNGSALAVSLLLSRLSSLVRAKASLFRPSGAEYDDLAQEGMIGLLSAIYAYNASFGVAFKSFASVCVTNKIASFVKSLQRKKQTPLNNFDELDYDITDEQPGPEEQVIERDELCFLKEKLFLSLSETERKVITLYLAGCSYDEIAEHLGFSAKAVDNALQRVRRKLRKSGV